MKATIYSLNINPSSSVKAYANLDLGNGFAVHGLKVINGQKGLFVSTPSRPSIDQNGERKFRDIFHPITKEARAEMQETVLTAYKEALEQALQYGQQLQDESFEEKADVVEYEEPDPEFSMNVAAF